MIYFNDCNYSKGGLRVWMIVMPKPLEMQAATFECSPDIQLFVHRSYTFILPSRLLLRTTVEI